MRITTLVGSNDARLAGRSIQGVSSGVSFLAAIPVAVGVVSFRPERTPKVVIPGSAGARHLSR
jgi:hypothetical protein